MKNSFEDLVKLMKTLRGKEGCAWDKEQTFESMKKYLLSETNEVIQAIDNKDYENLKEELGDLMFNIIFISEIAEEKGLFDIKDAMANIKNKLVKRHPHVFGNEKLSNPVEIARQWEEIKKRK